MAPSLLEILRSMPDHRRAEAIQHRDLMQRLARRICAPHVLHLIKP